MAARPLVGLALAGLLLAGCGTGGGSADAPPGVKIINDDGLHGAVLADKYDASATPLVDTEGAAYSLTEQTTKPLTLVFFGYTNCPDVCQMVMANIASALTRLDDEQQDQVDVVFVTTDPARDDGAALSRYLGRFDPRFIGLTGDLADIVEVGESFRVFMENEPQLPTGGYNVSHTTHVFAVDDHDQVPVVWSADRSAADIASDLATLLS